MDARQVRCAPAAQSHDSRRHRARCDNGLSPRRHARFPSPSRRPSVGSLPRSARAVRDTPRFFEYDRPLIGKAEAFGFGTDLLSVRIITKARADGLIKANHYSRAVVWSSSVHLGVYSAIDLIGAMQFGPAMNPASGAKVVRGTEPDQWLELNRMWLADDKPANTASRAIRYALTLIRRRRPRV